MSVANPWIAEVPAPVMSHVLLGVPALEFSHATGFRTGAQGSAASAAGTAGPHTARIVASRNAIEVRRTGPGDERRGVLSMVEQRVLRPISFTAVCQIRGARQ